MSPEEIARLKADIESVLAKPDLWLEAHNERFFGRRPIDMLEGDSDDEHQLVRREIDFVLHGTFL